MIKLAKIELNNNSLIISETVFGSYVTFENSVIKCVMMARVYSTSSVSTYNEKPQL